MTRSFRKVINEAGRSGHKLWIARENDDAILWCSQCHGHCTSSARHLGSICDPSLAFRGQGPTSGRRFRSGLHPQTKLPLYDIEPLGAQQALWLAERFDVKKRPPEGELISVDGEHVPRCLPCDGSLPDHPHHDELDMIMAEVYNAEIDNEIDEDVFGHGFAMD